MTLLSTFIYSIVGVYSTCLILIYASELFFLPIAFNQFLITMQIGVHHSTAILPTYHLFSKLRLGWVPQPCSSKLNHWIYQPIAITTHDCYGILTDLTSLALHTLDQLVYESCLFVWTPCILNITYTTSAQNVLDRLYRGWPRCAPQVVNWRR